MLRSSQWLQQAAQRARGSTMDDVSIAAIFGARGRRRWRRRRCSKSGLACVDGEEEDIEADPMDTEVR